MRNEFAASQSGRGSNSERRRSRSRSRSPPSRRAADILAGYSPPRTSSFFAAPPQYSAPSNFAPPDRMAMYNAGILVPVNPPPFTYDHMSNPSSSPYRSQDFSSPYRPQEFSSPHSTYSSAYQGSPYSMPAPVATTPQLPIGLKMCFICDQHIHFINVGRCCSDVHGRAIALLCAVHVKHCCKVAEFPILFDW